MIKPEKRYTHNTSPYLSSLSFFFPPSTLLLSLHYPAFLLYLLSISLLHLPSIPPLSTLLLYPPSPLCLTSFSAFFTLLLSSIYPLSLLSLPSFSPLSTFLLSFSPLYSPSLLSPLSTLYLSSLNPPYLLSSPALPSSSPVNFLPLCTIFFFIFFLYSFHYPALGAFDLRSVIADWTSV